MHCVVNVGLRKQLNLYKPGYKIYDLLVLPGASHFSFPSIFLFLDKRTELLRSFIEASPEIRRKIKYSQAKQRTYENMLSC